MPNTEESFENDEIDVVVLPPTPPTLTRSQRLAQNPLLIPGSILLGALIIGICLIIGLSGRGGTSTANDGGTATAPANVDVKNIAIDGDPFIGKANAPVTLVYWSDYQCPFCKAFEVGGVPQINTNIPAAMPDIIKNYVDTGKVKVVFKEFPFLGQDSITGAEYAYAIWDLYPAQFYNWRIAMFKAQDAEGDQGFGDAATIDALITKQFPQLSLSKIKQQITSNKASYDKRMNDEKAEGGTNGVQGTPGFVTGTKLIGGDAPFSDFKKVIDPQL